MRTYEISFAKSFLIASIPSMSVEKFNVNKEVNKENYIEFIKQFKEYYERKYDGIYTVHLFEFKEIEFEENCVNYFEF